MSNAIHNVKQHLESLNSGEPGSTGREVFEDSTATGPGAAYSTDNTSGQGEGFMSSTTAPPGAGTGVGHHGTHGGAGGIGSQAQGLGAGVGSEGLGQNQGQTHGTGQGLAATAERKLDERNVGTHDHHSHDNGGHIAGAGAAGAAAGALSGEHTHHHHGAERNDNVGGVGQSGASTIDEATAGSGAKGHGVHTFGTGHGDGTDRTGDLPPPGEHLYPVGGGPTGGSGLKERVGDLAQGQHQYERTGAQGPATGGAAGTDRFDTDKHSSGGVTGGQGVNTGGAGFGGSTHDDIKERAHDKGTGGVGGILGTTDKEFTGRDRLGDGAYETDKKTDAPGGQSALTGREGNFNDNPLSGDKDAAGSTTSAVPGGVGVEGQKAGHHEEAKPGLFQKIKEML